MKSICLTLISMVFFCSLTKADDTTISVFDEILFYDGYAGLKEEPIEPIPENVLRHSNSLYAVKLTDEQLASFGEKTTMHVIVKAACDNYDRIGNVNLSLVPKGEETYTPGEVDRIELGRYITPFMNKNKQPDEVQYSYPIDYIKHIVKEKSLLDEYDLWIELELFGVPYAANTQVAGCAGRSDVFYGTLYFETSTPAAEIENDNLLLPLFRKARLNNYQEKCYGRVRKNGKK